MRNKFDVGPDKVSERRPQIQPEIGPQVGPEIVHEGLTEIAPTIETIQDWI